MIGTERVLNLYNLVLSGNPGAVLNVHGKLLACTPDIVKVRIFDLQEILNSM